MTSSRTFLQTNLRKDCMNQHKHNKKIPSIRRVSCDKEKYITLSILCKQLSIDKLLLHWTQCTKQTERMSMTTEWIGHNIMENKTKEGKWILSPCGAYRYIRHPNLTREERIARIATLARESSIIYWAINQIS